MSLEIGLFMLIPSDNFYSEMHELNIEYFADYLRLSVYFLSFISVWKQIQTKMRRNKFESQDLLRNLSIFYYFD